MDGGRPAIVLDEALAGFRWLRGYVEDVAHALVLAVQRSAAAGRTDNVAYPVTHTEAEWVREIGRVVGWQGEIVARPASQLPESLRRDRFDYRQHFEVDSSRIHAELGYTEQVAFEEALRRTVAWERANPPDELKPDDYDYEAEDAVLSVRPLLTNSPATAVAALASGRLCSRTPPTRSVSTRARTA